MSVLPLTKPILMNIMIYYREMSLGWVVNMIQLNRLICLGNRAYRTINSDIGAWFIHVLLQIIEERYEEDHFEDMLVLVRNTLALKHEWRKGGYCQMACSWTTLTKRFYLK